MWRSGTGEVSRVSQGLDDRCDGSHWCAPPPISKLKFILDIVKLTTENRHHNKGPRSTSV